MVMTAWANQSPSLSHVTRPHPLQQARRVLADVREAADDVVQVKVAEGGVVFALPPHLDRDSAISLI